ncbi:MAG: hypothetical protein Kow0077_26390 [Anaerolineae bacterium]
MQIGDQIGPYTVIEHIGRGGMADVWSARDERLQRTVAIKTIMADLSSPDTRARFEHEARTIAALEHSHILPVYDFGEFRRQLYIVMRYVSGGSLLDRIIDRGWLSYEEVVQIGEAVASALERAHAEHVVHRDLKPANILLDRFGVPYLADFGLAAMIGGGDEDQASAGTLVYMPPEQMLGQPVDHRADIYAFGITLFQMLTGEFPFGGQGALCLRQIQFGEELPDPTTLRRDLPEQLTPVLRIATAMDAAARFDSAAQLMAELAAALTRRSEARAPGRFPEAEALQGDAYPETDTVPEFDEDLIGTLPPDAGLDVMETLQLASAELAETQGDDLPRPLVDERLLADPAALADPATLADVQTGMLEARRAFQRMVRVWARGQGRFLTAATPFANIHAYFSRAEQHDLVIGEAGREVMLRGAIEHDYALDFWLAQNPDVDTRRRVYLHALRSDAPAARERATRLLIDIPDGEGSHVVLAAAHLLHAEVNPGVRRAVLELLGARGTPATDWREAAFNRDVDLLVAEQALRQDAPDVAELAARLIGRLRMAAAVHHILADKDVPARQLRCVLAWIRDEVDALPPDVPLRLRQAAFLRLTRQKLTADLGRLGLRYFLSLLGTGLGLGIYVDVMFPSASLLQLLHLYRVVGNATTFGLVAGLGGTLAAALPLRLAGHAATGGAALWSRPARFVMGAGLGTLAAAVAYLNFQVLALQYPDPQIGVVLLGGAGLAVGAALAATFRWPLVARMALSAGTLFAALYGAWRANLAGTMDAIIFLRGDVQVWLFAVMAILAALGIWGPEGLEAIRARWFSRIE